MNLKLTYRPDIDGLRAIAVLSILFYHAGIGVFSGGYVGVDVFFVISGYLITCILTKEIQAGNFSLLKFYERRIRRIYPAVFSVIVFTLIGSALLYDASEYVNISKSAISITFFLSNMFFWRESGYFEAPSTLKPLLHTWSLSIEEQFYIIFPIILVAITRFLKSRIAPWVALLTLASFAANVYSVYHFESAGFYFMPLRAWELLTGSLLALMAAPTRIHSGLRNIFSLTGILLILVSVISFTADTLFPGLAALIPVSGAALILYSGMDGKSFVGNILSLRPIVWIGKISYSLYLWHWPFLVFTKYYLIREATAIEIIIWLTVTFTVSNLSWKFIENPFREKTFLTTRQVFASAGIVMLIISITSASIYLANGIPQRFAADPLTSPVSDELEDESWGNCLTEKRKEPPTEVSPCTIGSNAGQPVFFVWGDSHSRALAPAINESASAAGVSGYLSSMPGCPPLLGIDRPNQYVGTCNTYNDMIVEYIKIRPELKTIILTSRWAISVNGTRFRGEEGTAIKQVDMWTNQEGENAILFDLGLNRTVAKLLELDRNIVFVSGIPEVGYDVLSAYSIAARTGRDLNAAIAPSLQEYQMRNREVMVTLNSIKEYADIQTVDPSTALCDEQICYVVINQQPIYRDDDHLSTFGAHYISYIFDPIFKDLVVK